MEKNVLNPELLERKLPLSFIIRNALPEDAAQIAKAHIQCWQESYSGIIEQNFLDSISFDEKLKGRNWMLSSKNNKQLNLVACNKEGKVIGFCDIGPATGANPNVRGEVYAIYILEENKRNGIGSAFWKQAIAHFSQSELFPFCAWVLEKNQPARMFYEKQNGSAVNTQSIELGGRKYDEVCYLFDQERCPK